MPFRINFIVEGQTEEEFVNTVLRSYFINQSIIVTPRLITTHRNKRMPHIIYRGGLATYRHAHDDIYAWVRQDPSAVCTTMFDLYGLPEDFPGYRQALNAKNPYERVEILETALGDEINNRRFIPYIQLHEFEALLFSDLSKLSIQFPEYSNEIDELLKTVLRFDSPEMIDDGLNTAPSKRIVAKIPEYGIRKISAGPIVAQNIGLAVIQERCRHFREWLEKLSDACKKSNDLPN